MAGVMLAEPPLTNFAISAMTAAIYANPRARQRKSWRESRFHLERNSFTNSACKI
jgi:hypothetical protein